MKLQRALCLTILLYLQGTLSSSYLESMRPGMETRVGYLYSDLVNRSLLFHSYQITDFRLLLLYGIYVNQFTPVFSKIVSLTSLPFLIHSLKNEGFQLSTNLPSRVDNFFLMCLGTTLGNTNVTARLRQSVLALTEHKYLGWYSLTKLLQHCPILPGGQLLKSRWSTVTTGFVPVS